MAARIRAARELGDLKENADYHIAKEDQAHLETRIKRLRERLLGAVVVEADPDAESFAFGRTAEVVDDATGSVHTWTLVGSTEADLAQGCSPWRPRSVAHSGTAPSERPCGSTRRAAADLSSAEARRLRRVTERWLPSRRQKVVRAGGARGAHGDANRARLVQ